MSRVQVFASYPMNAPLALDFDNFSGIRLCFDDNLCFGFCDIYNSKYERRGL